MSCATIYFFVTHFTIRSAADAVHIFVCLKEEIENDIRHPARGEVNAAF